jgi:DNA polymerase-3 subunit beta
MSLSIQKKELFELLQKSFPIIPLKSSLQILSNFRLSYNNSKLEISATDLDHFIRVFSSVEGSGSFEITVNARKLFEIVRELPEGLVYLDLNENVLIIRSEMGFSCKIAGADVRDFPGFPEEGNYPSISISSLVLKDIITKGSFASAKDESRAVLCGVFFEVNQNKIGMVSTDGHRLGYSFYNDSFPIDTLFNCVISPKSLLNLSRIFDTKNNEKVSVKVNEKYIVFSTQNLTMYSKLLEGPYPDYLKVIPKNNPKKAVIDRNQLQIAVKRVSVLSNQKTHLVKFSFTNNKLEIVVINRDIGGEAREEMVVGYDYDNHTIGFNSQYLLEILDIVKSEKIIIEMNTQISACLIFPKYKEDEKVNSDDLFLIMPLRILEDV